MDNNFNRVRLCGRAAGEPALSHINHGEHFYRFPLSVERLSGQEDLLPVILPRRLLEEHPVHTGDTLTLTGQLRSFNNRSGQGPRLVISVFVRELIPGGAAPFNQIQLSGILCKTPTLRRTPLGREIIDLTPPALRDPITTAEWESRLEAIAQGRETLDAFLAEQKKILPDLLAPILGDGTPAFPCPSCGAALNRRKRKKDGSWFWGCTAYPACKVILPDDHGKPGKARPKPALSEHACPACGKPLVKRSGAKGEFYGCSGYPGCKKTWPVAPGGAPDFNAKKRGK